MKLDELLQIVGIVVTAILGIAGLVFTAKKISKKQNQTTGNNSVGIQSGRDTTIGNDAKFFGQNDENKTQ